MLDDEDTFTQFSYACKILGVEIKTTSVAQAKGRIERLNLTFRSRLPAELRRAHVHDIEFANQFLNLYLKKFNKHFSLRLNTIKSVYENNQLWKRFIKHWLSFQKVKLIQEIVLDIKTNTINPLPKTTPLFMQCQIKHVSLLNPSIKSDTYNIDDQLFMMKEV